MFRKYFTQKVSPRTLWSMLLLLLLGVIFTIYFVKQEEEDMKQNLLSKARLAAESINADLLEELTGSLEDKEHISYIRIKEQLKEIRESQPNCRFLYLMGKNKAGKVFFFVDSQPEGSEDYVPPGAIYEDVPDLYLSVFQNLKEQTVGPVEDQWGQLMTALIPIRKSGTDEVLAILGMDVTTEFWFDEMLRRTVPVVALVIVSILLVFYIQQFRLVKSQKLAEKKIRESQGKFYTIFNNVNDAIVIMDIHTGAIVDVNNKMLRMFQYDNKQSLMGKSLGHFSAGEPPYTAEEAEKKLNELMKYRKPRVFEWHSKTSKGSLLWIEINMNVFQLLEESYILVVARDITERKKAEQNLEISNERYKFLFEQAADGILIGKYPGTIIDANKSITLMSGYSREELIGMNIKELFPDTVLQQQPLDYESVLKGETVLNEREMVRKDGKPLIIEMNTRKISDGRLQAFLRDITERKKVQQLIQEKNDELTAAQEELRSSNEELRKINKRLAVQKKELQNAKKRAEESDKLKSIFLANMSHEIRTPMNGIIGFSEILLNQEFTEEEQDECLQTIYSQAQNLMQIIDDIIDLSKIEANQLTINKEIFNVNDILDELYSFYKMRLKNEGKGSVSIHVEKPLEQEESCIYTDLIRFKQILNNLLNNAMKFTLDGSISFGYTKSKKGDWLFYVKDTGIGIPGDKQEEIFERFRRVDESSTSNVEGTGLGLSIVQSIVEKMGGKIWVESRVDEGSKFTFTLSSSEAPEVKNIPKGKPTLNVFNWQGKSILVVEDDAVSQLLLERVIYSTGAQLHIAPTAKEGLEIMKSQKAIDLILMDVRLPDMDGLEATALLRKEGYTVPVIIQTAHSMSEDRKKAMEAGADDYVSKPIDINILLTVINRFIKGNFERVGD